MDYISIIDDTKRCFFCTGIILNLFLVLLVSGSALIVQVFDESDGNFSLSHCRK